MGRVAKHKQPESWTICPTCRRPYGFIACRVTLKNPYRDVCLTCLVKEERERDTQANEQKGQERKLPQAAHQPDESRPSLLLVPQAARDVREPRGSFAPELPYARPSKRQDSVAPPAQETLFSSVGVSTVQQRESQHQGKGDAVEGEVASGDVPAAVPVDRENP